MDTKKEAHLSANGWASDRTEHIPMSVSKKDINPLTRIPQLHREIADAELELRRLRLDAMVALRATGMSLRSIGKEVGLSHGAVNQALAVYEAGKQAAN